MKGRSTDLAVKENPESTDRKPGSDQHDMKLSSSLIQSSLLYFRSLSEGVGSHDLRGRRFEI